MEHYHLIHDIYVLLDAGDRDFLSQYDLTTSQYAVLKQLDEDEGQRLTELSERVIKSKSTITRIIDHLEQKGYAERLLDPSDRRAQRVILTRVGAEIKEVLFAAHVISLKDRMSSLTANELKEFASLLQKLRLGLIDKYDARI